MISRRHLHVLLQAFIDGFGFTGLFTHVRRPGAPVSYLRRDDDEHLGADPRREIKSNNPV
jgi:hypothetical protein